MRFEKKSETLEIRVSQKQKQEFMNACADEDLSASEKLREFIAEFLKTRDQRHNTMRNAALIIQQNPLKAVTAATAILMGWVAISASPTVAQDPVFAAWDDNADGYISADEFQCEPPPFRFTNSDQLSFHDECTTVVAAMDFDGNNAVGPGEFTTFGRTTSRTDSVLVVAGERVRRLEVNVIEWDASMPPELQSGVSSSRATIPLDAGLDEADHLYDALMRSAEQTASGANYESEKLNRL